MCAFHNCMSELCVLLSEFKCVLLFCMSELCVLVNNNDVKFVIESNYSFMRVI